MSDAMRRAAGIPDTAPHYTKDQSLGEILRTGKWLKTANLPALPPRAKIVFPDGVSQWIEDWSSGATSKGLLLVGPVGTGKTTMMSAVMREVLNEATPARLGWTREEIPNRPVFYYPYHSYIAGLQRMMTLESRNLFDDEYDQLDLDINSLQAQVGPPLWHTRLACLDDIGTEHLAKSGWAASQLNSLLRSRDHAGFSTCATSNLSMDVWGVRYGEAAASFAFQAFTEVAIVGKDRRR